MLSQWILCRAPPSEHLHLYTTIRVLAFHTENLGACFFHFTCVVNRIVRLAAVVVPLLQRVMILYLLLYIVSLLLEHQKNI